MNYCKHLKKRKNKPYCILLNKEISFSQCRECDNKEYKTKIVKNSFHKNAQKNKKNVQNAQNNRNIVQKKKIHHTKKRITVSKETYNVIIQRDNYSCRLCGSTNWLALHHILYRSERKDLINDIDNCIMLCESCHRTVHSNKKKWQPILLEMNKK